MAGDHRRRLSLDRVAAGLKETAYRLEHGRGITLIRGIPVDRHELDDLKRLYLGLGGHMGTPVIQNGGAGMMREVRDTAARVDRRAG